MIMSSTGRLVLMETPKSPWRTPLSPPPRNWGRKLGMPCAEKNDWSSQFQRPVQPPYVRSHADGVGIALEAVAREVLVDLPRR